MQLKRLLLASALLFTACAESVEDDEDGEVEGPSDTSASALSTQLAAPELTRSEKNALVDERGLGEVDAPKEMLGDALAFLDAHKDKFSNRKYVTLVDYGEHSGKKRFYLVNLENKTVERTVVAHGSGSDREHDGIPSVFSNTSGSNQSSLGYFKTAETYSGKHGYSLRLDGVSSTNSKARARAIVMHNASYVSEGRSKQGRSWGCFVVPANKSRSIIDRVKAGSLVYATK